MAKKNNDDKSLLPSAPVTDVIGLLNEKIASLKHIEETVYKTSGQLDGFGDIKNEMKIENLIRAWSSVRMREKGYLDAAKDLDRKEWPAFTIGTGTSEQWKHDITLRIAILEHKETLDKLTAFRDSATKLMSEQDQKVLLFAQIGDFLGVKS